VDRAQGNEQRRAVEQPVRVLEDLFLTRVRSLPPDVQRLLLLASADDAESAALVARAHAQAGGGVAALDAAELTGLIKIDGARLEFRHPLMRSAVYNTATSTDRGAAHLALAAALEGDREQLDRRTWHLASIEGLLR
jgi:hypothetical protein